MNIPVKHSTLKPTILLNFVLDESGSMEPQREQVISGFNEYIQTMLEKADEADYLVNVTKFNTHHSTLFVNTPLRDMRKLTKSDYNPKGGTALYDAIGATIKSTQFYMDNPLLHPKGSDSVSTLFFIFTDGEENSSHIETGASLKETIEGKERKGGWTFTFIGATADCVKEAAKIGISWGNSITYNAANMHVAMRSVAAASSTYTSNVSSHAYGACNSTPTLFKDAGIDNMQDIDSAENLANAKKTAKEKS